LNLAVLPSAPIFTAPKCGMTALAVWKVIRPRRPWRAALTADPMIFASVDE
jgi:hypothetical protein